MSPEAFALMAEMLANNAIDLDRIIEHVRGPKYTFQPEPDRDTLRCFWCEAVIATPQDAYLDELLTGVLGYWYCSEACRDAHVEGK